MCARVCSALGCTLFFFTRRLIYFASLRELVIFPFFHATEMHASFYWKRNLVLRVSLKANQSTRWERNVSNITETQLTYKCIGWCVLASVYAIHSLLSLSRCHGTLMCENLYISLNSTHIVFLCFRDTRAMFVLTSFFLYIYFPQFALIANIFAVCFWWSSCCWFVSLVDFFHPYSMPWRVFPSSLGKLIQFSRCGKKPWPALCSKLNSRDVHKKGIKYENYHFISWMLSFWFSSPMCVFLCRLPFSPQIATWMEKECDACFRFKRYLKRQQTSSERKTNNKNQRQCSKEKKQEQRY